MGLLLRIQGLKFKNWLTRGSAGDRIKAAAFAFLGLLFLSGVHWGFLRFLTVIRNVELVGDLLLLENFGDGVHDQLFDDCFFQHHHQFLHAFFSRDLSMLVHTPLPYRTLFAFKSLETMVFSSWMMVLALLPFLAAFGQVTGQGARFLCSFVGVDCSVRLDRERPGDCLLPLAHAFVSRSPGQRSHAGGGDGWSARGFSFGCVGWPPPSSFGQTRWSL
jgi:hypothetical protein